MLVVLTLGLAGCGSDEPAAVTPPAPPPAPPPFQPQPVEVALGELGGTVTLMTTEAGGFTLNGEAFEGGEVTAENGNRYALSLADGQWTAAYQAATATLTLGITGEEVTVMRAEDGTYWIGDEAFEPGGNFAASNGNHYMLALADDGSWTASYVPATAAVALGITGEEVTVMRAEDGSYWIGDAALSSGGSVTATNGNEYTLTMADGTWTAAYVPLVQQVAVGNSGLSVPFTRHENGTWTAVHPTLGEQPVTSGVQVPLGIEMYYVELLGDGTWRITYVPKMVPVALGISGQSVTVVKAENGTWSLNGAEFASGEGVAAGFGTYTLTLGSGDTWTAAFNEVPTTVTLGTSGDMVTVVMVEDGSYTLGGDPFASGGEVTAGNGNVYQLTLAEGAWSAMFVPMDVEIGGTGLTAMTREDQDGWDVNGARVPKSGTGDITVHGASFHVWQIDGDLFGARFDKAINSDSAGDSDPEADIGLAGDLTQDNRMMLSDDNEDTVANELRTSLTVGGNTFTMADLLGAGSASASGDNFVVSARAEIEKIRGDVAALLGLDTAPPGLTGILTSRWGAVQTEVNKLFGAGKVNLGTTAPGNDDILGEIDDILAALSSGTQFAAATDGDGSGVFKGAALSESAALEAFDANESESRIVFGSTGETRYGAISQKEREYATSDLTYKDADDATAAGLVGAFSYATTNDVVRVWHIQTSGNAYYEGGTTAVSGDGTLYSGDIELEVKFSSKRVSGLVTGLQTAEGDPWQYQFGDVEAIILPTATDLDNSAHWDASGDAARAQVTFERRAGSPGPQTAAGTFAGQLLGTGDASGDWAHGVWTVGSNTASGSNRYLAGSFGANRVADTAPVRPGTDDGSGHETIVMSGTNFKLEGGNLVVTVSMGERILPPFRTRSVGDPSRRVLGSGTISGIASRTLDRDADFYRLTPQLGRPEPLLRELKVGLASLVSDSGSEVTINGPGTQVELAVEEIEKARADLAVLLALETRVNPVAERDAWRRMQLALLRVFHHVPPKLTAIATYSNQSDYNNPTSIDDKEEALRLIDAVLDAFASSANLKAALDPDGSGIFNGVTQGDSADTSPSYSHIWSQQEVELKTWVDMTEYTRFGVWRTRQKPYAAIDRWYEPRHNDGNLNQPGQFAYSPLPATQWSGSTDPSFPSGGSASFTGKTVLFRGLEFFEGWVEVLAEWTESTWTAGANQDIGDLTVAMGGFMNAEGDPMRLVVSDTGGVTRIEDIHKVTFSGVDIVTDADRQVGFSNDRSSTQPAVVAAYWGPLGTRSHQFGNTNRISGEFVGQDADGPLGVIGTYEVGERNWASYLTGSFGADRP